MTSLAVIPGGAPKSAARRYHLTDIGNAELLFDRHGHDIRFVPKWNRWFVWDGRRWAPDDTLAVHRLAKESVRSIFLDAISQPKLEDKEMMARHAIRSESDARVRAMLERVKAEPGVSIRTGELDQDPWLLTVENGTIDLRTGELHAHRREDLITKLVPVAYDPLARCDLWELFLRRVLSGNDTLIHFLQLALGYSLTGSTAEQCLFFLYGSGANGKSTFLEVVRALLQDYAQQADFTTFLERKSDGPRNDIARLVGTRLVTSSEVGEGKRLNESLVKTLTGTDTITARFLHAEFFEFAPTFKFWLAANHRPVIRGQDHAIWRRMRLIPFTVQIPEEERDPELGAKLREELPGILAWAVAGCVMWQREGLSVPSDVQEATDSYRRDSDTLGAFLEDCCVEDADARVRSADLYAAYRHWVRESGEYEITLSTFGNKLQERGFAMVKSGVKYRVGLRLRDGVRLFGQQVPDRGRDTVANEAPAPSTAEDDQPWLNV